MLERHVIIEQDEAPLMVLERYAVELSADFWARQELQQHVEECADDPFTWGYFPGISVAREYPCCVDLEKELNAKLLSQMSDEFVLTFIRLATRKPQSKYGGLHIDVDRGVGHVRTHSNDIVRLLVNLGEHPRTLEYVKPDLLEKTVLSRDHYEIIEFSETSRVEIPPKTNSSLWVLKFWSSIVPHAGITNDQGHFLAAYGMYADKEKYEI